MTIPTRHRPIFDGLTTGEEKFKAAMAEYDELKETDADGLDFSNKTAMWIAFERDIETQREDALFKDVLAKYFTEPYGQRLSDSMSFGLAKSVFDPPDDEIGFGLEGHVMYTAARTKLINDQVDQWLGDNAPRKCQVLNLGAGADTRVYWMESLKKATAYWEVDTASVMNYKQKILDSLQEKGELPETFCERKVITMDFSKESIAELPSSHGYQSTFPSCWILEGLIMYLKREDQEQLLDNVSKLSEKDSFLVLNFFTNFPGGLSNEEIDERLGGQGWKKTESFMFGEEGFNFGRYPKGKPANKVLGFAMYRKE
eukprot:CAMPEP_0201617500 /NCGR_PEP_ID=MMETSP0492-20130828/36526_1 /ASSEMBLY_ACC=CAM_ASM_000837 /TAXON_ID=420259 /ORGANISM="Thalassiosira gravida, Strain GMp14c1" /LENGTH=313 /DNA_ID=CAMNT_0048085783 /DNA_START=64 /DNA_END=1005 /DNA_ORIENTATION=+